MDSYGCSDIFSTEEYSCVCVREDISTKDINFT